jgi:hypothetical protein
MIVPRQVLLPWWTVSAPTEFNRAPDCSRPGTVDNFRIPCLTHGGPIISDDCAGRRERVVSGLLDPADCLVYEWASAKPLGGATRPALVDVVPLARTAAGGRRRCPSA